MTAASDARLARRAERVELAGTRLLPHEEQPTGVLEAVTGFLAP